MILVAAGKKRPLAAPNTTSNAHTRGNQSGPGWQCREDHEQRHDRGADEVRPQQHGAWAEPVRKAPPNSDKAARGMVWAITAAESATGEAVRSSTNHATATTWKGSPIFETAWPIHRSRKSRLASGAVRLTGTDDAGYRSAL